MKQFKKQLDIVSILKYILKIKQMRWIIAKRGVNGINFYQNGSIQTVLFTLRKGAKAYKKF